LPLFFTPIVIPAHACSPCHAQVYSPAQIEHDGLLMHSKWEKVIDEFIEKHKHDEPEKLDRG